MYLLEKGPGEGPREGPGETLNSIQKIRELGVEG